MQYGKKINPPKTKREIEKGETFVKSWYWSIELTNGSYVLEYLSGSHGGGVVRHNVTQTDFDDVWSGRLSYEDLMRKKNFS